MLQAEILSSVREKAIGDANRQTALSPFRKRKIIAVIKDASSQEVAREGKSFLTSCSGASCLVQGDLLPPEAMELVGSLKLLFDAFQRSPEDGINQNVAVPSLSKILYKPFWRPRPSLCSIPGTPLISDSCGRIPR
jgi:hypothetical protein